MIEPGVNMQTNYRTDPDNYRIISAWQDTDAIISEVTKLNNLTNGDNCLDKMSPDAARLIMDNTLIIRQLLDIMIRTIQGQQR